MTAPDPPIPPPLADLLAGVGRAHEGDADAIEDVVTDDVTWADDDEHLDGVDEVVGHFLAHGGWREVFVVQAARPVDDVPVDGRPVDDGPGDGPPGGVDGHDGDRWEVDWTLWLRADATSYRRDGTAQVLLADGRIAAWTSTATEREDGSLAAWGGD